VHVGTFETTLTGFNTNLTAYLQAAFENIDFRESAQAAGDGTEG
jgi:hypothetical protein